MSTVDLSKQAHKVLYGNRTRYAYEWHTGAIGLPAKAMPELEAITEKWAWHFDDSHRLILTFEDPADMAQAKLTFDLRGWERDPDQGLFYTPYLPLHQ